MELVKDFFTQLKGLCPYAKGAIGLGALSMLGYYIAVIIATAWLPYSANIPGLMALLRDYREAAPATFVAALAAALICDLITRDMQSKQ